MVRNFSASFTMFLMALDMVSAVIAVRLAEYLRTNIAIGRVAPSYETPWAFYILVPLIWALILNANTAYSPRGTYRAVLEIYNLIRSTMISVLIVSGFLYIVFRDYSRVQAVYLIALLGVLTITARGLVRLYFRLTGGRKYDSRRIVIVGTTKLAQLVGRQVRSYAWTGLYLLGYLASEESTDKDYASEEKLNVIGNIEDIEKLVDEHEIDEVIFAIRRPAHSTLAELVQKMYQKQVNVRLAPDVMDFAYLTITIEEISGLPLISLREPILSPSERIFKRIFDMVACIILFILCFPLMVLIAIIIRLESPGGPLYVQERVGENRRIFKMYKFRTMIKDADLFQDEVSEYDANGNIIHKKEDDPRVTRVGRFLRRTSLDELPQIVNILKGDMSLVGPRPEMPWMVDKYEDWQLKRFEVPQGLTGWWQINGRSETLMHLSTEDDLYYILNYSIALDLLILLRTPSAVLSRRGAF